MADNLKAFQSVIQLLTDQEVREAFKILKAEDNYRSARKARQFSIGDRVKFTASKSGRVLFGAVTNPGKSRVELVVDGGELWKVPGTMLERVEEE